MRENSLHHAACSDPKAEMEIAKVEIKVTYHTCECNTFRDDAIIELNCCAITKEIN
jgi:hypothetical protein